MFKNQLSQPERYALLVHHTYTTIDDQLVQSDFIISLYIKYLKTMFFSS